MPPMMPMRRTDRRRVLVVVLAAVSLSCARFAGVALVTPALAVLALAGAALAVPARAGAALATAALAGALRPGDFLGVVGINRSCWRRSLSFERTGGERATQIVRPVRSHPAKYRLQVRPGQHPLGRFEHRRLHRVPREARGRDL